MRSKAKYKFAGLVALMAAVTVLAFRLHAQSQGITVVQNIVFETFTNGHKVSNSVRLLAASPTRTALLVRDNYAYASVPGFHYRLLNSEDGTKTNVFDPILAKSTFYLPQGSNGFRSLSARPAAQCDGQGDQLAGSEMILGMNLTKITHLGQAESTRWVAPEYGCFEVQAIFTWRDATTQDVTAQTSYIAASVVFGQPDASVFAVPANYVEMAPNQAQAARLQFKYKGDPTGLARAEQDPVNVANLNGSNPAYQRYRKPRAAMSPVEKVQRALGL